MITNSYRDNGSVGVVWLQKIGCTTEHAIKAQQLL